MQYEIDKNANNVIFELPLSDYLPKQSRYNSATKQHEDKQPQSLQELEEDLFMSASFSFDWVDYEIDQSELNEATQDLIAKGYTSEELAAPDIQALIVKDIQRAKNDAFEGSYLAQWLEYFRRYTADKIEDDLASALGDDVAYTIIDRLDAEDYWQTRGEATTIRIAIALDEVKSYVADYGYTYMLDDWHDEVNRINDDWVEVFIETALDYDSQPINTDCIDDYNRLGDTDNWFQSFTDNSQAAEAIDAQREADRDRLNNLERAALELKPHLEAIAAYIAKYITQEPARTKITRQIKALKSIIKNAA